MAAPAPSTRQNPSGHKLGDGMQTLIVFASDRNIEFWEKSVTPPGIDGGDAADNTTMHNTTYRTKSPKKLIELTDCQAKVGYDPAVYNAIVALCNVPTTITCVFPDESTLAFYGFLKSFMPDALEEGNPPEATITIVPTNQDPNDCSEAGPVYTAGTGTSGC